MLFVFNLQIDINARIVRVFEEILIRTCATAVVEYMTSQTSGMFFKIPVERISQNKNRVGEIGEQSWLKLLSSDSILKRDQYVSSFFQFFSFSKMAIIDCPLKSGLNKLTKGIETG